MRNGARRFTTASLGFILVVAVSSFPLWWPTPAGSTNAPPSGQRNVLERVMQPARGENVRILTRTGDQYRGRVVGVDADTLVIRLSPQRDPAGFLTRIPLDSVADLTACRPDPGLLEFLTAAGLAMALAALASDLARAA